MNSLAAEKVHKVLTSLPMSAVYQSLLLFILLVLVRQDPKAYLLRIYIPSSYPDQVCEPQQCKQGLDRLCLLHLAISLQHVPAIHIISSYIH